ncbi:hypothetical protein EDC96DRAFT_538505 [Choanephora cucurbitarum]|nr:hypothetical protein EDC96DRAFT_538505 [Choanephora cucurbitarum]
MNQEQLQQTFELLKSMNAQLVSLNERMVKVENALANSSIIPVRYRYDEIKEKHIKITVTTKLIRDALEEANLDKDPKHVYKSMQKAAASQARRLLLSVYEGKRVSWTNVEPTFRESAIAKANKKVKSLNGFDPHRFESDWAMRHLIQKAYTNKYDFVITDSNLSHKELVAEPAAQATNTTELVDSSDDSEESQVEEATTEASEESEASETEDDVEPPALPQVNKKRKTASVSSPVVSKKPKETTPKKGSSSKKAIAKNKGSRSNKALS